MVSQAQAISKILSSKDFSMVTLNNLDESFFFDYAAEFKFIRNHYDTYHKVPDVVTFLGAFPDFDYVDVAEPDSYIVSQLFTDYNTNVIATSYNKMKKLIEAGKNDEAQQYYLESLNKIKQGGGMTCTDIIANTSRYDRYLDRTANPTNYRLKTGFKELDQILGGIDRKEENMVIIARPGIGKTQVLLKMAAEASKQDLKVGIYEGEMTADKVGYRIDTFLKNIENTAINRGELYIKKEYEKYIKDLPNSGYGSIKVLTPTDVPSGIVTVDTLKAFIERYELDVLFVDQYDLLDDTSYTRAEFERVGNIAKAIKKLQVEKKIPIISVSQMNRTKSEDENGKKIQDTTQVAGSDKISRYATTIIALEQKKTEGTPLTELTLNIIKARDGGDGNKLKYTTDFNMGTFKYIPTENDGITTKEEFEELANSYNVFQQTGGNEF